MTVSRPISEPIAQPIANALTGDAPVETGTGFASFDGVSGSYIQLTSTIRDVVSASNDFTLRLICRWDGTGAGNRMVFASRISGTDFMGVGFTDVGTQFFCNINNGAYVARRTFTFPANQWHELLMTVSSGVVTATLNGDPMEAGGQVGSGTVGQCLMGSGTTTNDMWPGDLREVQIWSDATQTTLAGSWPLSGNANDISGNGQDGIVFGGVTFETEQI